MNNFYFIDTLMKYNFKENIKEWEESSSIKDEHSIDLGYFYTLYVYTFNKIIKKNKKIDWLILKSTFKMIYIYLIRNNKNSLFNETFKNIINIYDYDSTNIWLYEFFYTCEVEMDLIEHVSIYKAWFFLINEKKIKEKNYIKFLCIILKFLIINPKLIAFIINEFLLVIGDSIDLNKYILNNIHSFRDYKSSMIQLKNIIKIHYNDIIIEILLDKSEWYGKKLETKLLLKLYFLNGKINIFYNNIVIKDILNKDIIYKEFLFLNDQKFKYFHIVLKKILNSKIYINIGLNYLITYNYKGNDINEIQKALFGISLEISKNPVKLKMVRDILRKQPLEITIIMDFLKSPIKYIFKNTLEIKKIIFIFDIIENHKGK